MDYLDAPDLWRKDLVANLRLLGPAVARLPYGMPEPMLTGLAAMELYSGGLWPTPQVELLTVDAHGLQAELTETGFRPDENSRSDIRLCGILVSTVESPSPFDHQSKQMWLPWRSGLPAGTTRRRSVLSALRI